MFICFDTVDSGYKDHLGLFKRLGFCYIFIYERKLRVLSIFHEANIQQTRNRCYEIDGLHQSYHVYRISYK